MKRPLAAAAAVAALVAPPLLVSDYLLSQFSFVAAYAVAGLGLVVLSGHGGQISLGQAAFLGVGACTEALLAQRGVPLPASLAAAAAAGAAAGWLASLPTKRLSGLDLTMATLAFGFLVEEGMTRWESVTGGARGLVVGPAVLGGIVLQTPWQRYLLAAALCAAALLASGRLLDSRFGRSLRAVRDDETAAALCGIDAWRAKRSAFLFSAGLTGLAGALLAHELGIVTPEQFGIGASVELLLLAWIGGAERRSGAVLGAAFVVFMPGAIALLRDWLPDGLSRQPGLQPFLFGLAVVLFVLYAPRGIAGLLRRGG